DVVALEDTTATERSRAGRAHRPIIPPAILALGESSGLANSQAVTFIPKPRSAIRPASFVKRPADSFLIAQVNAKRSNFGQTTFVMFPFKSATTLTCPPNTWHCT